MIGRVRELWNHPVAGTIVKIALTVVLVPAAIKAFPGDDPRNSLFAAYRVLFEQWRLAFEIGAANRRRGVQPTRLRALIGLLVEYKQSARHHLT